jgi:two-component system, OmpR family, phosphate regulon response regulator PhoB
MTGMLAQQTNRRILIVDSDLDALEPLRHELRAAGYSVSTVTDPAAAVVAVARQPPHLVIADWRMPGFAELELIRQLRDAQAPHPIRLIILSHLSGEQEVVAGLNLGADDYIAKPFSLREVVARVSAVLRSPRHEESSGSLSCDELVLDVVTNRVTVRGQLVRMRRIEYRLLAFFMSHAGQSFNRTQLLAQVWGEDCAVVERTVDVNIQRLRKILNEPGYGTYIQTIRGFGYRFAIPAKMRPGSRF